MCTASELSGCARPSTCPTCTARALCLCAARTHKLVDIHACDELLGVQRACSVLLEVVEAQRRAQPLCCRSLHMAQSAQRGLAQPASGGGERTSVCGVGVDLLAHWRFLMI